MTELNSLAYLISIRKFEENDHILSFILENNEIIAMFSKSSQKTLSKNGRFLLFNSLLEVEFFINKIKNKLCRLKKIKPIKIVKLNQSFHLMTNLLNEYLIKNRLKNFSFKLYQELIELTFLYDIATCILVFLKNILIFEGLQLILDYCCKCKKLNVYSFSLIDKGFLCKSCFSESNELKTSKNLNLTLYFLFKNNLNFIQSQTFEIKFKIIKIFENFLYELTGIFFNIDKSIESKGY